MLELSYKPYPCCRFVHTAIDAALNLRQRLDFPASRVRRVRVGVNRLAYEAVCTPIEIRKAPQTIDHAQFSIPIGVAAALLDDGVTLEHFSEAALQRQDILALAQRVDTYVHDDIERDWGRAISPAQFDLELDDGSMHSLRMDWALGHPRRPMSTSVFDAKALNCIRAAAVPIPDRAVAHLRQQIGSLGSLADVRTLLQGLTSTV